MKAQPQSYKLKRSMGWFSLTMMAISCMLGSGWLFGAYYAAKIAGPLATYSWLIGGAVVFLVALCVMQASSAMPKAGGLARYIGHTHGPLAGFMLAWCNWLGIVAIIPIEAEASLQYFSNWTSTWHLRWLPPIYNSTTGDLTIIGLVAAALLLVGFLLMNYYSMRLLIRAANFLTAIKVIIPVMTVFLLFRHAFDPGNFTTVIAHHTAPHWSAALTAISASGIVMAFNGFQTPATMAAETRNPRRNVAIAIAVGIVVCLILYEALQVVFIGTVDSHMLSHGWQGLHLASPFAQLAIALNLNLLLLCIYCSAFISPSAAGMTYMTSSARILYGMGEQGYMPKFMTFLDPKYHVARWSLLVNLGVCFVFLLLFKGWGHLAGLLSVIYLISYTAGPIAAAACYYRRSDYKHMLHIPGITIIAPLSFILLSLLFYWAKWPLTGDFVVLLMPAIACYLFAQYRSQHCRSLRELLQQVMNGAWFLFYVAALVLISYYGSKTFGGLGLLNDATSMTLVISVAIMTYAWAMGVLKSFQKGRAWILSSIVSSWS